MITTDKIEPIHPSDALREDFIEGFGTSEEFWINLQTRYVLELAEDRAVQQIAGPQPEQAMP